MPNSSRLFYEVCTTRDIINITLDSGSLVSHLFAVVAVFIFCVAVVGVMVLWRNDKINLIEQLVEKINQARTKKQR